MNPRCARVQVDAIRENLYQKQRTEYNDEIFFYRQAWSLSKESKINSVLHLDGKGEICWVFPPSRIQIPINNDENCKVALEDENS